MDDNAVNENDKSCVLVVVMSPSKRCRVINVRLHETILETDNLSEALKFTKAEAQRLDVRYTCVSETIYSWVWGRRINKDDHRSFPN